MRLLCSIQGWRCWGVFSLASPPRSLGYMQLGRPHICAKPQHPSAQTFRRALCSPPVNPQQRPASQADTWRTLCLGLHADCTIECASGE